MKQQSRQARLWHRLNLLAMTCQRAATESAQHLGVTECWRCVLGAKFTLAKLIGGSELRNGWSQLRRSKTEPSCSLLGGKWPVRPCISSQQR
jgi:hypothetical protein